jgi:Holliday junction resolvasome RuvABC endonuclease subunit
MSRIILGLDPAGNFGFAAYDLDKPFSAIESGSFKLQGETVFDKIFQLRRDLVPMLREIKPAFAGIESPFKFAPQYKRPPKRNMLTGVVEEQGEATSINPATISDCGQIAGAATALCLAWNVHCAQFQPRTWQAVIPKAIHSAFSGEGAPKKRAKAFCDAIRITSPNIDSRDAALIAIYTAGCQEFKMLQQRQRAA